MANSSVIWVVVNFDPACGPPGASPKDDGLVEPAPDRRSEMKPLVTGGYTGTVRWCVTVGLREGAW